MKRDDRPPIAGKRSGSDNTRDCKFSASDAPRKSSASFTTCSITRASVLAYLPHGLYQILTVSDSFRMASKRLLHESDLRSESPFHFVSEATSDTILSVCRFDFVRARLSSGIRYQSLSSRGNLSSFSATIRASSCLSCDVEEFVLVAEVNDF